jgi:serine/threonine protein kinase
MVSGATCRPDRSAIEKKASKPIKWSAEMQPAQASGETKSWRVFGQPRQNGRVTSARFAMSGLLPLRDTDPREVGAYRLLGRLGEGGQGVVFLADSPAGSRTAVKLLPPTTDPQVRNRFLKEVAAAQRVARFCTAQVVDAGIFERRPFIVSEYVDGPSLVEVVEQFGPRSGAALERIAVATLTALGAVHAVGMVHRDFKPANVLLGPDGPVVIDFGLATVPGMTTTGISGQVAVGTPAFMSPEQLAGKRVTAAADMWSWGVTIAYAGTGQLPFQGDSLTATAFAILNSDPQVGSLPGPLGLLVHRCLSKDPAARPSAREALGVLVAAGARLIGPMPQMAPVLAEKTPQSHRASGSPAKPRRRSADRRTRPRRRVSAIVTVVVLAAGAGGLAFTLSQQGASSQALAAEAAIRAKAIAWILHQVSRGATVSCDSEVCADLANRGFPSANLVRIGPTSNDPLGSDLVVATAVVRAQFGSRLASVYAPAIIASFGSGRDGIEVRLVVPGGAESYRAAQSSALHAREAIDAQLLTNSNITLSTTARAQLLGGEVDPRLPALIVLMAAGHPLRIVEFLSQSPGGGAASLLRWADFAPAAPAAQLTPSAYVSWMRVINAQRAEYRPPWSLQVTLPDGQAVLRIGYGAPSPLL